MSGNPATKDIVKSIDAIDLVGGTIAKPLVETALSPVVGNGNLISGCAKLGTAFAAAKYGGSSRPVKMLAIGAGMDGAEDLVVFGKKKIGGGVTPASSGGVF